MYLVLERCQILSHPIHQILFLFFCCFNVEPNKAAELFSVGQVSLVAKNTSSSLWEENH